MDRPDRQGPRQARPAAMLTAAAPVLVVLVALVATAGCGDDQRDADVMQQYNEIRQEGRDLIYERDPRAGTGAPGGVPEALADVRRAVAVLDATASGSAIRGTVLFAQTDLGVRTTIDLAGLEPGRWYRVSIAGTTALASLAAGADGDAHVERTLAGVTVPGPEQPILGRSVVVHAMGGEAGEGDEAGAEVATGVIGVARPAG